MPDDYYVSKYSGEEIDALLGGAGKGTVRYDAAQSLTDAQKAQARGNIAAAPDGYGLGSEYAKVITNWDDAKENGIYKGPAPSGIGGGTIIGVTFSNSIVYKVQIIYPDGIPNCSAQREMPANGIWTAWEWVNPPMQLGIEYRTTERYLSKPVYAKLIDCGNLPAPGSTKNVSHGVSGCLPIMVTAQMSNSNTIPWLGKFTVGADNTNIVLYSPADGSDFSGLTAMAILKYIKTTD